MKKFLKKLIPMPVFRELEPIYHLVMAFFSALRYGFPAYSMRIIGITGTNGKTTTSVMVQKMMYEAGLHTGILSTAVHGYDDKVTIETEHMTTAPSHLLQKRLREFKNLGCEWVVVETTSHALAQHRVFGIPYEIVAMTNVTHEHLDYHRTFARYVAAKVRLFRIANRHGERIGIVNADDKSAGKFAAVIKNSISYGIEHGDVKAENIELDHDGVSYTAIVDQDEFHIKTHIPGVFNVYNSLACLLIGKAVGLRKEQIERGIADTRSVEGRMQSINAGQKFNVIVDYAHTPDAFEILLSGERKLTKGKLIVLFGSAGGPRDPSKRFPQGEIAGKYADEVVVTEEDDRYTDGNLIMQQIADGAIKSGKKLNKDLHLILDRQKAIEYAMTLAKNPDDLVLLLGKGHERTIERANETIAWNEPEEAVKAIKKLLQK